MKIEIEDTFLNSLISWLQNQNRDTRDTIDLSQLSLVRMSWVQYVAWAWTWSRTWTTAYRKELMTGEKAFTFGLGFTLSGSVHINIIKIAIIIHQLLSYYLSINLSPIYIYFNNNDKTIIYYSSRLCIISTWTCSL